MEGPKFRFWSRYSRQYLYEPKRGIATVSFVSSSAILLLFFFGIKPQYEVIKERLNLIHEREEATQIADLRLGNARNLEKAYEETTSSAEKLNEFIPDNDELSNFIENASIIATKNNLQLVYFAPMPIDKNKKGQLKELTVRATVEGNGANLLNFIKDLEGYERFIGVKTINFKNKSDGSGETTLDLVVYYFKI